MANIGVWGMSMGAATALWFSSLRILLSGLPLAFMYMLDKLSDADWVTCIIADSPFAKLTRLAQEIVHQQEARVGSLAHLADSV